MDMFTTIGVGLWLGYVVGALEIDSAIGLLIPRLSGLAALLVVLTVTNLFTLGDGP
jgi:putative oxidoreductase